MIEPGLIVAYAALSISAVTALTALMSLRNGGHLRLEMNELRRKIEVLEEEVMACEKRRAELLDENIELMRKIIKSIGSCPVPT